ncbi:MAG: metalloregulator ArsR/SmtB family transcription factor [Deltaproteobacteria bacterium]|nr:metalloregulator ArsR/SmtB family transcription factor [Deltaproteobacteria bacterium]
MKSDMRLFKNRVYEQLARITKAVASPQRLELLDLLSQSPRTVENLAQEAHLTVANTSRHLQILRAAQLINAKKEGVFVRYRLTDDAVADFYRALRILASSHLAELDHLTRQFFTERAGLEPVDRKALLARVRKGLTTVIDVRPVEEYRAGHIAGAISIPVAELTDRLADLPRDQEIVAYCRGPYCVLAAHAVELLRKQGFPATRLEDSVADWRAHGLPIATVPVKTAGRTS